MLTRLATVTPPVQQPVSLDMARRHLRSLQGGDDELLQLYIQTATEQAESYLNRTLLTTTYRWTMSDTFPSMVDALVSVPLVIVPIAISFNGLGSWQRMLEIPRGPVQSVASLIGGVWDGADATLVGGTDYSVDLGIDPPRLRFNTPLSTTQYDHLSITYTAGMTSDPHALPASLKHAVLLLTASLYERRGDEEASIPSAFYRLLDPVRLKTYPAA